MTEPPRTEQELWAMLPNAWVGSRRDLVTLVGQARDRLVDVRECANRDIEAAREELTNVVVAAWMSGASWRTIGVLLGISRQAAARRYGRAVQDALDDA